MQKALHPCNPTRSRGSCSCVMYTLSSAPQLSCCASMWTTSYVRPADLKIVRSAGGLAGLTRSFVTTSSSGCGTADLTVIPRRQAQNVTAHAILRTFWTSACTPRTAYPIGPRIPMLWCTHRSDVRLQGRNTAQRASLRLMAVLVVCKPPHKAVQPSKVGPRSQQPGCPADDSRGPGV